MLDRNVTQPWLNDVFYRANYPVYSYDPYASIVTGNNLIPDLPVGYQVMPRAFDESTDRVIFIEQSPNVQSGSYSVVLRDVPIQIISPYMPPESHGYHYGSGMPER